MCARRVLWLGACLACFVLAAPPQASAGWWWHHRCGGSAGSYSSGGGFAASAPVTGGFAASAPASAPAAAPAYYYYAPMMPQAAPQAAPPQAALREAIEIIKIVSEIAGQLRGNGGPTPISPPVPGTNIDLSGVPASLNRLEAGQADLRGRLINAAGVQQSMGKSLVKIEGMVDQTAVVAKLDEILKKLPAPPPAGASAPPAPAPQLEAPTDGKSTKVPLRQQSPTHLTEATWMQRR